MIRNWTEHAYEPHSTVTPSSAAHQLPCSVQGIGYPIQSPLWPQALIDAGLPLPLCPTMTVSLIWVGPSPGTTLQMGKLNDCLYMSSYGMASLIWSGRLLLSWHFASDAKLELFRRGFLQRKLCFFYDRVVQECFSNRQESYRLCVRAQHVLSAAVCIILVCNFCII